LTVGLAVAGFSWDCLHFETGAQASPLAGIVPMAGQARLAGVRVAAKA
jgi:hypothetical protein